MILRIWHGWTSGDNADAYQQLLDTTIVPNILARGIPGLRGVDILRRRDHEDTEAEFVTIMTFDDWEAVESFAGPDTTGSVVPPTARRLLARYDQHSQHYELVARHHASPGQAATTTPGPEPLHGRSVRLRPTTTHDAPRLAEILGRPEVARWWGRFDLDRVQRELVDPDDGTVPLAVEADGQVIGLVQYLEEVDPDYRHAAVDLFLHPDWHGRGLGADTLRTLARHLFEDRGHHRLTIDPAAHNRQAIHAYRRVGFRPVGVMRRSERGPDGQWHDGLLMDLLPEDLTEPAGDSRTA